MNARELRQATPGTRIITRAGKPGVIKGHPNHAPAFALVTIEGEDWMVGCGDMDFDTPAAPARDRELFARLAVASLCGGGQ